MYYNNFLQIICHNNFSCIIFRTFAKVRNYSCLYVVVTMENYIAKQE